MPDDPHLYGQRPPKRQKKQLAVSNSVAFTSQLSALLAAEKATPSTAASSNRVKSRDSSAKLQSTSKASSSLFGGGKSKRKPGREGEPEKRGDSNSNKLRLKSPNGTEDDKEERARARRNMETKARLYAAMKRGDYIAREGEVAPLVDFDRKWAEAHEDERPAGYESSSGDDRSEDDGDEDAAANNSDNEIVEYEDEFGRLRTGTKAAVRRMEQRLARGQAAAAELENMSARPRAPENLMFGHTVQTEAFIAQDSDAMEALARKRDRSATPPEMKHYDANKEVRTKGVGFFQFSKDESKRAEEMAALEAERLNTERVRKEREQKVALRKREIEERRRQMAERRAQKMADSFLDGLGTDITHP
jgi:hypothetical protein